MVSALFSAVETPGREPALTDGMTPGNDLSNRSDVYPDDGSPTSKGGLAAEVCVSAVVGISI